MGMADRIKAARGKTIPDGNYITEIDDFRLKETKDGMEIFEIDFLVKSPEQYRDVIVTETVFESNSVGVERLIGGLEMLEPDIAPEQYVSEIDARRMVIGKTVEVMKATNHYKGKQYTNLTMVRAIDADSDVEDTTPPPTAEPDEEEIDLDVDPF